MVLATYGCTSTLASIKVIVSRNFTMQYHIQKVCTKVQLYFFLYWSVYQKVPIMQKSASTGIPLEFTNLKKYQFSGSWCVYTPKIHHAWVSKTNSLCPTIAVAFLHLRKRTLRALYFMVRLSLLDPNLISPIHMPPCKDAQVTLELFMPLGALHTHTHTLTDLLGLV